MFYDDVMKSINIYNLSIYENIDEATISKWLTFVAPKQRERLLRFHFREDFLRSLFGEAMLRIVVGEKVGIPPESLKITRPERGRPFFLDYPELHFNISHSGDWAVCALSEILVGIDIEEVKLNGISSSLVRKVLTEKEQEYMEKLPDGQKNAAFYRFWTIKEAYAKCDGRGLGISLNKIDIDIDRQAIYLVDEGHVWNGMMKNIDFQDDYMMAVCAVEACEISMKSLF